MMVHLTIDGQPVEVEEGTTILQAAKKACIHIPTLCYHEDLSIKAVCRICVVEVEGQRLLPTAAICTGRSEVEIADEIGMGGSGQLKKYVTEAVNEYFAPIRERRQRYENDLNYIKDVLHEGNRRANEIAEQTLAEVQDAMGMVY